MRYKICESMSSQNLGGYQKNYQLLIGVKNKRVWYQSTVSAPPSAYCMTTTSNIKYLFLLLHNKNL